MTLRREQIGDATLYLANALEILPKLDADVIITDPPYSQWVHANSCLGARADLISDKHAASRARNKTLGFAALTDAQRLRCAQLFSEIAVRWTLVFSDIESSHLWRTDLVRHGMDYCRTGIWHKLNSSPQFTGDRPAAAVETITIAHSRNCVKRWNGRGRHAFWEHAIEMNRGGNNPRQHTTQKPLPLMNELVHLFTEPSEVVLDPFMGSGTTGVAAVRQGRKFVGVEIDSKFFDAACKRLHLAYQQRDMFIPSPTEKQESLL